jgi:hypothetical protein
LCAVLASGGRRIADAAEAACWAQADGAITPAMASNAVETAVRSRRTSRSINLSSAVASLTGDSKIGSVMVRRENASTRACRWRS